jgi:nuclear pore complex protein Nup98-Nup96
MGDIQLWYRAVYETLAGEIDARGNALSQMGLGKRVDWRRAYAMRLWFGIPADGEIKDAVQEYWMACQQDSSVAKPLPWYAKDKTTKGVYDGLFQLLRLYSGSGVNTTLDDTLNPYNFSSAVTDVRISWHLYIILSELKGKASFADAYGMKANPISDAGEKLTLAYVTQLEDMDLWQWAIYVALHLRRENTRKGVIMDILARHIATIPNQLEEQGIISRLVEQWKIPMEWILEAKVRYPEDETNAQALHARSRGNHLLCAKNLVLAKSLSEAQKTILAHIAPQAVISTHLSDLEDLLLMFDSLPAGWEIGGQIYSDYIVLVQDRGVGERRRRASGSRRDSVVRLLRGLPAMEAQSFEQRVAQSEMARVVANIVVSSTEFVHQIVGKANLGRVRRSQE